MFCTSFVLWKYDSLDRWITLFVQYKKIPGAFSHPSYIWTWVSGKIFLMIALNKRMHSSSCALLCQRRPLYFVERGLTTCRLCTVRSPACPKVAFDWPPVGWASRGFFIGRLPLYPLQHFSLALIIGQKLFWSERPLALVISPSYLAGRQVFKQEGGGVSVEMAFILEL